MISQAWTMRQRQEAAALLRELSTTRPDISLTEAVAMIDGSVASALVVPGPVAHPLVAKQAAHRQVISQFPCPHCNTPLVPVANPDGLQILGCKKCRYSRILEGLNG